MGVFAKIDYKNKKEYVHLKKIEFICLKLTFILL